MEEQAQFVTGGGQMGERARAIDWSATPLGGAETWTEGLRAAVDIVLGAPMPMALFWGRHHTVVHNDAWLELFSAMDGGALGRPGPKVYPERWRYIESQLKRVLSGHPILASAGEMFGVEAAEFSIRLTPVHSKKGEVAGILAFVTGAGAPETTESLADREFAQQIVETFHEPLLVLTHDLRVKSANPAFYEHFQVKPHATLDQKIYNLGNGQWNIPALRTLLEQVLPENKVFNDFLVEHEFEDIGHRTMLVNARRLDHVQLILLGIRDITEVRRAEQAIAESEARYRSLVTALDEGFCVFDVLFDDQNRPNDYRFVEANPAFESQTGLRNVVGRRMRELAPDHEEHWFQIYGEIACTGEPRRFIQRAEHLGDRWYSVYAARVGDPDQHRVAVVFTDITAQRRAEAAVRASEKRYRELVEQITDYAIFRIDTNSRCVTWNAGVQRVLGFTEEEFIGTDVTDVIFTPEDLQNRVPDQELLDAAQRGTACNDRWMRRKSGEPFFAFGVTSAIRDAEGRLVGFTKIMRDHTRLVEAEAALKESESRFRTLADAMPQLVWEADAQGAITYYNARASQFDGIVHDEKSRTWRWDNAVHPDDATRTIEAWNQAAASGNEYRIEHRIRVKTAKGARYRWFLSRAVPVRDESGAVTKWYGTATDIHALKKAEQEVRRSEERFRQMADAAPAVLWVTDRDSKVTFLSRAWQDVTGQSPEEALGRGWAERVHPDDRKQTLASIDDAMSRRDALEVDYRLRQADGTYRWVTAAGRPWFDADGELIGYIGSVFDVHERKQAQEAIQRSHRDLEQRIGARTRELQRRAEQLSRLASELSLTEQRERRRLAQILHDHLQQLLVGANLRLDIAARKAPESDRDALLDVHRLIDEAIGASRSLTVELAPPILHEAGLEAGLDWLARWMKAKHELDVELHIQRPIKLEREDVRIFLFQSVRELLFNVVKHAGVTEARVAVQPLDDDLLKITVSDQGKGFDPIAAIEREAAGRSGFGLFSIQERLSLLGGQFSIDSRPEKGSRFTLTVPMYSQVLAADRRVWRIADAPESRGAPEQRADDTVRILIADDHKVMREGLNSLLAAEPGVEVCGEAADGVEAVERTRTLHPNVVLMDYSLPRMDGLEATRQIKAEFPEVEVIGLSMYEEPDRATAMLGAGAAAYLTKSGRTDALLEAIRAVRRSVDGGAETQAPD